MGLEFSFDEISLDQKVSGEQLEIDLYDELATISEAEPEEQVRLLAVKPVVAVSHQDDKPESIRITGSAGKEHSLAAAPTLPVPVAPEPTWIPLDARPAGIAKAELLHPAYPLPQAAAHELPLAPPAPPNRRNSGAFQSSGQSPRTKEIQGPARAQAPVSDQTKSPQTPGPLPKAAATVPTVSAEPLPGACPDCGNPASELDMICIECGAFIG